GYLRASQCRSTATHLEKRILEPSRSVQEMPLGIPQATGSLTLKPHGILSWRQCPVMRLNFHREFPTPKISHHPAPLVCQGIAHPPESATRTSGATPIAPSADNKSQNPER